MRNHPLLMSLLMLAILGCHYENSNHSERIGELIPIDYSDEKYIDLESFTQDTLTANGWDITYLVKNDSTRYNDLYIKWSKGNIADTFLMQDVLLMRRYFIAEFESENTDFLYLTHGCATSCFAVLTLSKKSPSIAKDFIEVIDYDPILNQIAYIPERSFSLDTMEIAITDLSKGIEKAIIFDQVCTLSPESGCIDSISFQYDQVEIYTTLTERNTNEKIKEKHNIKWID